MLKGYIHNGFVRKTFNSNSRAHHTSSNAQSHSTAQPQYSQVQEDQINEIAQRLSLKDASCNLANIGKYGFALSTSRHHSFKSFWIIDSGTTDHTMHESSLFFFL